MADRISKTFKRLKQRRQKALIGYITAGFPTKASLKTLVPLLEKSGTDILEIGVPFSDPIADGPTIQYSSQLALKNGVTLAWILQSVKALRQSGVRLPLILMSYSNPIHAMGIDRFFQNAKAAGVDGLIIPDIIPEEAEPFSKPAKTYGVDLIFLVAPTTPKARIKMISDKTRGFLYAVSLTGVTGVRQAMPTEVASFLKLIKTSCRKPVAVGFGITTPQQARDVSRYADGVIVGSALIRQIEKSKQHSFKGAAHFMNSLKSALDQQKGAPHAS